MSLALEDQTHASDWYAERYQAVFVSRNRWLVTAWLALGLAALQALALVGLTPLKRTLPYLVREESSGSLTTIQPLLGTSKLTFDEAIRKYFVAKYVRLRETYDPVDVLTNYRAVELLSDDSCSRAFRQAIVTSNPASPVTRYGSRTRKFVYVKAISFLSEGVAQVRYSAAERDAGSPDRTSEWIATLGFRFANLSLSDDERLVNPIGFLVTSYRVDQEIVP